MDKGIYERVSQRVEKDWYPYHEEEWFTHKDICDFFDWRGINKEGQEIRQAVSYKLYHDYKLKAVATLEKSGKAYRLFDRSIQELDWTQADISKIYKLTFPYDIENKSNFWFEDNISIPPKGIILVAGVSNMGKTTFLLNLMVMNMDVYNITYFTCELTEVGFKRRMKPFENWCELYNGDKSPKFRVIERYDHYHDVLDPDGFNIIDYLDVNEEAEYFKIKSYIRRIKKTLDKGIAVIALQKPPGRPDAYGGANLRGDADLYLAIDYGKLTVVKAKDWHSRDPNNVKFSFEIEHSGSMFTNIKELSEEG